jgi:hypothetical protein
MPTPQDAGASISDGLVARSDDSQPRIKNRTPRAGNIRCVGQSLHNRPHKATFMAALFCPGGRVA